MRDIGSTLRQILEFIEQIEQHCPESRPALAADLVLQRFMERQIELIGEAATRCGLS